MLRKILFNTHMTGIKVCTVFLFVNGAVLVVSPAFDEMEALDKIKNPSTLGNRYHSLNIRDPFIPLVKKKIVKPKPVAKIKPKPVAKLKPKLVAIPKLKPAAKPKPVNKYKERKGPAGMPLIPILVYEKIKDTDPKMQVDLKYYEKIFNNKVELGKMTDKKYNTVVFRYRKILLRTQKIRESFLKTELQIPYSKLVFVGTIFKNNKIFGLVETHKQKGYGVKIGTLVGPNLGIVEDINKKGIIITERFRNYLGEVLEKKQKINFRITTQPS